MQHFIIDGTNVCAYDQRRSLAPLLQLCAELLDRHCDFSCYFDFNTARRHLSSETDRSIYGHIVSSIPGEKAILCGSHFTQALSNTEADRYVLKEASRDPSKSVISHDFYRQEAYQEFWTEEDRKTRWYLPKVMGGQLILIDPDRERVFLDVPYKEDVMYWANKVIQHIEGIQKGHILTYDDEKQQGWIQWEGRKRSKAKREARINFRDHGDNNTRVNLRDKGAVVHFEVGLHQVQDGKAFFEAINLKKISTPEELQEENEQLRFAIQELFRQMKEGVSERTDQMQELDALKQEVLLMRQNMPSSAQELVEQRDALKYQIQQLENDKLLYQHQVQKQQEEILQLKAELDKLRNQNQYVRNERNELFLSVANMEDQVVNIEGERDQALYLLSQNVPHDSVEFKRLQQEYQVLKDKYQQQEKMLHLLPIYGIDHESEAVSIETLQAQINALLLERSQLQHRIEVLEKSMNPSENSNGHSIQAPESNRYEFPEEGPTLIHQGGAARLWWEDLSEDWQKIFRKVYHIQEDEPELAILEHILDTESMDLRGHTPMLPRPELSSVVIRDLSGLRELSQLKALNLSLHQISSIDPLFSLRKLELLNLTHNRIQSLTGVEALRNLQTLYVRGNKIPLAEIERLQQLRPGLQLEFDRPID